MKLAYLKPWLILSSILFIVFVLVGDRFLPEPLGPASAQTRVGLSKFVVGLIPQWERKTDPNKRTLDAIEQEEAESKGK
ncbi:hypothetical protein [Roseofilum casamattae]|uniref:Uncharacterized protein n=1 Tax=Roseofilum casamattae BLCC-M143 TaxID=3022442 RepID=A0ABT7BUY2_9CYAN|nr:hypothetical protein [Roseofilum casamattae]MDJ1182995.1 hypothetical protein [Roseofilum casamattae BLCC-M143]